MQWMILNHQGYLVTLYYWIIHYSCHLLLSLPSRTYRSTTYIVHIILFIPSWLFSHLLHIYKVIILTGLCYHFLYLYLTLLRLVLFLCYSSGYWFHHRKVFIVALFLAYLYTLSIGNIYRHISSVIRILGITFVLL